MTSLIFLRIHITQERKGTIRNISSLRNFDHRCVNQSINLIINLNSWLILNDKYFFSMEHIAQKYIPHWYHASFIYQPFITGTDISCQQRRDGGQPLTSRVPIPQIPNNYQLITRHPSHSEYVLEHIALKKHSTLISCFIYLSTPSSQGWTSAVNKEGTGASPWRHAVPLHPSRPPTAATLWCHPIPYPPMAASLWGP